LQVDVTYYLSLINGGSKLHVSYSATYNTTHNNDESLGKNFIIKYLREKINL
jgi:hypothetical protein